MVNILNLSKVLSKVLANSPPIARKNIPADTAQSSQLYVSPEKMLYPTKQVDDNLPPPKKLQGTGPRGGNTPNDILIDKKKLEKVKADKKVSRIDQARILKYKTPVKPPSETTQARKAWKNLLKAPGSVSEEAAGSVRFQYFWSTFKPRTKFNKGIKKRVMDGTMTERQAIMTIKKHRKTNEKAKKNADQRANDGKRIKQYSPKEQKRWQENRRIEDELAQHDTKMYREGNRANKGMPHYGGVRLGTVSYISAFEHTMQSSLADGSFKNFGKYGEIRLPMKTSFADQEKIVLKTLHDEKVKKVNKLDNDAVALGYGLGGKKVPGWEKGLTASRVVDKVMKTDTYPPDSFGELLTDELGSLKYSDFESLQLGTEAGAFADTAKYSNIPIPATNKGASKDTGIFIFPDGLTGKSPNVPDNKNTHVHTKGRDPMVFGAKLFKQKQSKEVIQWDIRPKDPLAKEFRAPDIGPGAVKSPESWNIGMNPWEQNKQGGDFYTAGQQSYSRENAKLWRGIGLGLGGAGAMGLVGGQSAHASHYYDNEPPGSIFSRITPNNMKTMKKQITRRHHTNKNMFGNQQTGKYHDPTGFLSIHDQDLKHKGLPGKKAYSMHRKLLENSDGTWAFTQNI